MINDIGNILKGYVSTLPFADKVGGVVKAVSFKTDGNITKIMPVDCGVTHQECISGKYVDLMPNSTYKSVMYFEDQGTRKLDDNARDFNFESTLKLVCWLNLKLLGKDNCSVSALAFGSILKVLPTKYFNSGTYSRILISIDGQDIKNAQIFSKYTYDEEKTQFLMYPFDYFSLDITVRYTLLKACIQDWENEPQINCIDG